MAADLDAAARRRGPAGPVAQARRGDGRRPGRLRCGGGGDRPRDRPRQGAPRGAGAGADGGEQRRRAPAPHPRADPPPRARPGVAPVPHGAAGARAARHLPRRGRARARRRAAGPDRGHELPPPRAPARPPAGLCSTASRWSGRSPPSGASGAGAIGYPFRAVVDWRTFAYTWCKTNPVPAELEVPDPRTVVELPPACRGRKLDAVGCADQSPRVGARSYGARTSYVERPRRSGIDMARYIGD